MNVSLGLQVETFSDTLTCVRSDRKTHLHSHRSSPQEWALARILARIENSRNLRRTL